MPVSVNAAYGQQFLKSACSELQSAERILGQFYPDGAKCTSCGATIKGHKPLDSFWRGERTYCCHCDSRFYPRTGTILADSKLTYSQFEIILVCYSLGIPEQHIAAIASVHEDTVISWIAKFRFWESHV